MKKGYTLVELLIVITIIGILTTIAFVGFGKIQADARDEKRSSNATIIAEALEKYYDKNGEYPSVPAVTDSNITNVKNLLGISDTDVLTMPTATPGTNSITPDTADRDKIAYSGNNVRGDQATCEEELVDGACDTFSLQWVNESGKLDKISSRKSDRDAGSVLSPPKDPIINVTLSGASTVVGTISFDMTDGLPACGSGTVGYKILTSTTPLTLTATSSNWSSIPWDTSPTRSITGANNTQYNFYAIARCTSDGTIEKVNPNVASDSYILSDLRITASWANSNTNAVGTLSTSKASMCDAGLTPRYSIQVKIDTATTPGVWGSTGSYYSYPASGATTEAASWTTNPVFTITGANNPASVKRFTFRGKVRCDNNTTPGTLVIPASNTEDVLVSAPRAPALSMAQTGSVLRWTWPEPTPPLEACPAGSSTAKRYTGAWLGNFQPKPAIGVIVSGQQLGGVYNDGFSQGLQVTASCGPVTSKVLGSQSQSSRAAAWPTLTAGRGKLYTEYSSGNYAQGRVRLQDASVAGGTCTGSSYRALRVEFARNNTGAGTDHTGWGLYYDGGWGSGDIIVAAGTNMRSARSGANSLNDTLEVRTEVYCVNTYIGRNPSQRLVDRYGILRIIGNSDSNPKPSRYYITCTGQSINGSGTAEAESLAHCAGGLGGSGPETLNGQSNAWQQSW